MDIHKPKPWHGWREFLKEYLIIVVGVLTALGAEQVVAKARDAQLAQETRATARAELKGTFAAFANRRATQTCIDRRLDEVARLLAASERPDYRPPTWIGRPQEAVYSSASWDAAAQGGRVALLSQNEQAAFGKVYSGLHDLAGLQRDEQKAWADIRQLEDQPHLDPQMRASVRSALQQARLANWNVRVDFEQSAVMAERLGVATKGLHPGGSPSICLPTNTPREKAVAQVNAFFKDNLGEP